MKRVIGFIQVFTSIIWIALCIVALVVGLKVIDKTARAIDKSLSATQDGLERLQEALLVSPEVVSGMHDILSGLEGMALKTSEAIDATQPILNSATQVATQDIPDALQGATDVVPRIVSAVTSVESALGALAEFSIRIPNPLGKDLTFDLGLDYSQDAPMSQAFQEMGDKLQGMPQSLRQLETAFTEAGNNLTQVSLNMAILANSVDDLDTRLTALGPQLEGATSRLTDIRNELGLARARVALSARWAKWILGFLAVILALTALPPLYKGWVWLRGRSLSEV